MEASAQVEMIKAGTGEMPGLSGAIKDLQSKGYKENLTLNFDHFFYGPDKIKLYPHEIFFDEVLRFENSSDPDDQSILYAISAPAKNIKGLSVDSYGLYHDSLSSSMIDRMKFCHDIKKGTIAY